jgi:hypothetical protein
MGLEMNPIVERLGWLAVPALEDLRIGLNPDCGIQSYKDYQYAQSVLDMLTDPALEPLKKCYLDYAHKLAEQIEKNRRRFGPPQPTLDTQIYTASTYLKAVMRHYRVDLNEIHHASGVAMQTLEKYMDGGEPQDFAMQKIVHAFPVANARLPAYWIPESIRVKKIKKKQR